MDNMLSLKCKNCGFELTYRENERKYICEACDSAFLVHKDFSQENNFLIVAGILKEYTGESPYVIIPNSVLSIGENCFLDLSTIESVAIPESVREIKAAAFMNCTNLKQISLPDNIKVIGDYAFKNSGLISITIPDNIDTVGKDAFMECNSLKYVKLPRRKNIEYNRTFKMCNNLEIVDCDLSHFCQSFAPSNYVDKKGDIRPTYGDAFQETPFIQKLKGQYAQNICLICGGRIFNNKCLCCEEPYPCYKTAGCYIATAVYGSYNCPEVWTLRRFRDYSLANSWYGRAFIRFYYSVSPTIVRLFGHMSWFNRIFKGILDSFVSKLNSNGIENSPYEDNIW